MLLCKSFTLIVTQSRRQLVGNAVVPRYFSRTLYYFEASFVPVMSYIELYPFEEEVHTSCSFQDIRLVLAITIEYKCNDQLMLL